MTILLYCLILSTAFDSSKKTTEPFFFFFYPPPRLCWNDSASELDSNCVLYTSEGKTYCGFQVVHSACVWKNVTAQLSPVSQKGWEEENQLSNLPYVSHLLPANSTNFLINLAFKPLPDSLEKYDILSVYRVTNSHLSTRVLSAVAVLQHSPSISPRIRWFLLRQAPCSSSNVRLRLRWHGYCSLCMSAWMPTLKGEGVGERRNGVRKMQRVRFKQAAKR